MFLRSSIIIIILFLMSTNSITSEIKRNENNKQHGDNKIFYLDSFSIFRYNPYGLQTHNRIMFRNIFLNNNSPLFNNLFYAVGISSKISPSYSKMGPIAEIQPIAIFNIRMGYEYIQYFGTFGHLQSYPIANRNIDFSDNNRKENKDNAYSTWGHHFFADPTFQIKINNFAIRTIFTYLYFNMDLHHNDSSYYDPSLDTLVPNKKLIWTNDTDFIYILDSYLFGIRYSKISTGTNLSYSRLSPFIAHTFNPNDKTNINKLTLLILLSWYFNHPNRQGADPTLIIGASFLFSFAGTKQLE